MSTVSTETPRPRTLAEKVWDAHVVAKGENGEPDLIYIDLHLVHEVTSPQAFDGLRQAGRPVRRPDLTIATEDHNTPTLAIDRPIADLTSRTQIETLRRNAEEFGIRLHSLGDIEQGIVHVVGPQLGLTMPGITVVCGDSHTSTHGAFGAMAFGIGTSEVEHVLATQTLPLKPVQDDGDHRRGHAAPRRHREGHHPRRDREDRHRRRAGLRARVPRQRHPRALHGGPDDDLQHVDRGRRSRRHGRARTRPPTTTCRAARTPRRAPTGMPRSPTGAPWPPMRTPSSTPRCSSTPTRSSPSSPGAPTRVRASRSRTSCPTPDAYVDPNDRAAAERALEYMDLAAGTPMKDIKVDAVFMGSCTNSRIEDLRAFASIVKGKKKADHVRVMVVPGSARVRIEAEAEGLDKVFEEFGAEWRFAGCSMCLGMNPDQLAPGERCASTSNRNFEGRQGKGGRTHLVSPLVAAATAIRGTLSSSLGSADRAGGVGVMDKITVIEGIAVPFRRSNVDTDQIIPAQFLKRVTKTGFDDALFFQWRQDPDFILNQPGLPGREGAHRRPRLRHRIEPRARGLGAARLRFRRRHLAPIRRHLPRQLGQAGTAHRHHPRGADRAAVAADRGAAGNERAPSTWLRRR